MSGLFKKVFSGAAVVLMLSTVVATEANAIPIDQYASTLVGFSSQYSAGNWSAAQALGAPNTPNYGDFGTAWAAATMQSASEFLSLGYATAVYATGATVTQTFASGFVSQIDVVDMSGFLHTVYTGATPTIADGVIHNLAVSWAQTGYLVQGLVVTINNQAANWKEIDAVMLSGQTQTIPVPSPATLALLGLGFLGFAAARRRKVI